MESSVVNSLTAVLTFSPNVLQFYRSRMFDVPVSYFLLKCTANRTKIIRAFKKRKSKGCIEIAFGQQLIGVMETLGALRN